MTSRTVGVADAIEWDDRVSVANKGVHMKLGLSLVALLAATIVVPVASATGASSPACGDVVTTNVTLAKSLKGCASGLVVGADNVTIDLNGYAIKGLANGTGTGIDVTGRTRSHRQERQHH